MYKKGGIKMKNKFKIALMSLVLIPCLLLLTACSQAINVKDYNLKVKQSAEAFYNNYGEKDLVVTFTNTTTDNSKKYISWKTGESTTAGDTFDFSTTIEVTQTVTLDSTMAEGANVMNASIVKYEKVTEKGWKQNADKTAVVEANTVTETTTTQTFIDDVESRKVYTVIEVKVDGEIDDTKAVKEVYAFVTTDAYNAYIKKIATSLEKGYFDQFYLSSEGRKDFADMGKIEYFKDGKQFGYNGEFSMVDSDKNYSSLTTGDYKVKFGKDKLPKSGKVNYNYEYVNLNYEAEPNIENSFTTESVAELNYECKVTYEASVVAPTATDFATALDIESVDIDGMDF